MLMFDLSELNLLYDLALLLYRVSGYLYVWGWEQQEHWIGSVILTPALYALGDLVAEMATTADFASGGIDDLLAFVGAVLDGSLIHSLLLDVLPSWNDLITDPVYWVIVRVSEFWPDFYWLAQDPLYMVEFWLTELWPDFAQIITDAGSWLLGKIDAQWPDFYWFRQDPAYMVEFWILDRYPALTELFVSPSDWLRAQLSFLFQVEPEFWDDPLGNIREGLSFDLVSGIESQRALLYGVGEHLFRWFVEGVW